MVPSRSLGSLENRDFLLVEQVQEASSNKQHRKHEELYSLLPVARCLPLAPREANKVSVVAGSLFADATRDRAVVRAGEAPSPSGARSRLTLLLR